jgi:hypothetical protein
MNGLIATLDSAQRAELRRLSVKHPVGQSFHSGGWGWQRVNDCLNLNTCTFPTKMAATRNRNHALACRILFTEETK